VGKLLAISGSSGQDVEALKCVQAPGWVLELLARCASSWQHVEALGRMWKILKCVRPPELMFKIQALCMKSTAAGCECSNQ
jgi:hypothetical protein